MAAWLPIVKTALPIIAEIVTVARPMFTKKVPNGERDPLTTQQIEELQAAATLNSDSVKALAKQVKTTFEAMESAATELQKNLERQRRLTYMAMAIAVAAMLLSVSVSLNS